MYLYPRVVLKTLGEELETDLDNATSSSSESDSDPDIGDHFILVPDADGV